MRWIVILLVQVVQEPRMLLDVFVVLSLGRQQVLDGRLGVVDQLNQLRILLVVHLIVLVNGLL